MKPRDREEFVMGLWITGVIVSMQLVLAVCIVGAWVLGWAAGVLVTAVCGTLLVGFCWPLRVCVYALYDIWREG